MVRFWGFVALGALIGLIVTTAWPHQHEPGTTSGMSSGAQRLPDTRYFRPIEPNSKLAREALLGFMRVPDEGIAQRQLDRAHERLRRDARSEPEAMRAADVLLRRGFNAGEVDALLNRHALGFASVEAKTPVSDGTVMTFWVTQYGPPPHIPGTIAEQVERILGRQRLFFLRRARSEGDTERGLWAREIASSHELGVYRVELWGLQRELLALLDEPEVRGVVADVSELRAASFEKARREMESQPIFRGPTTHLVIPDVPNSELPPLPPEI